MSEWGRQTYGDPCRECGYQWSLSQEDAMALVRDIPEVFRRLIEGQDVSRRHPLLSWSVKEYICHVVDNLRISAERLAGAAACGDVRVGKYDADLLAQARNYAQVPIEGALWSLERASRDWERAIELSSQAGVVVEDPDRGPQTVLDVCRSNAHDAQHHRWDIERSLG